MTRRTASRVMTIVLFVVLLLSIIPANVLAAIPNWENTNVVFEGTKFGTDGYYNVISKKDYVLVPGAAVESEMVLNNANGTRRQVLHIIEVDPTNPDVSIVPGYNNIDKVAQDPRNTAYWGHQELTEMAKYYEDNLGYNIVGGMNTDLYYNTYSPRVLVYNGKSIGGFGITITEDGTAQKATSSILYVFKDAEGNISCDVQAFNKTEFDNYLASGELLHAVGVSFGMVVKDGKLVNTTVKRGNDDAARSMVGVKADGTLVLCMNDGRGANNSVGLSSYEEGEVMLALGCQWAANCDGGGSSTFLSKRVGEDDFTMRSVPCDGAQRPTAHGIFVASNVAPTGELDVVNVEADYDYFAPNTEYTFGAEAIDTHGYAMDMPVDASWALSDASFGTLENGTFVSNGTKGEVEIQVLSGGKVVGSKTIQVTDPEVFKLSATSTVVPYSTPDKVRTIQLPIVAMIGEANVYVDTNAVKVALSDSNAGTLNGFAFTATEDTSVAGTDITVTYGSIKLVYAVAFGKGSEIIFDFENNDRGGFMGFEEAKQWSIDNDVNNTLVGSDPLAGQFNPYLSSTTYTVTEANGGQVRNGDYALAWRLDNSDASFASWSYNVLFNTGDTVVLRDVANGKKAITLGMWLYIPENAFPSAGKGLAFQSQLYTMAAGGGYSCVQDHFMFTSAATGKQTNLNSATNADIPESRWVYASIDISKYDYLCTPVASDTGNSRSPSFIRTYVKPETADIVTFYIDDITLDYSSAVDDRVLPVISNPTYSTADTAVALNNGTEIAGNKIAFSATVSDNAALDLSSGKIFVDGIEMKASAAGSTLSTKEDAVLAPGAHTVAFEIKDELGNPSKLIRDFTVSGEAVIELSGHNDSNAAPKAQSIYYVDLKAADLENISELTVDLKMHNANTWETKGAVVAAGFEAEYDYNAVSEILTVTVKAVDTSLIDPEEDVLVSIPVRVWTFDRYNYVNNTYYAIADMGNKPVVNVQCEVVCGEATFADKKSSTFAGSIDVATELTTISSPYHTHDAELTILNQDPTLSAEGYVNRTYCETCKSVVDWGTILPKLEHNYQIKGDQFVCVDDGCGKVFEAGNGIFQMNGKLYCAIADKLVKGWQYVDGGVCYANTTTYELYVGERKVNEITYVFDENGVTKGAWFSDENGTKYSYGPDYWRCGAGNSLANAAWIEIDGKTYAFDRQGYRHEGIRMLVESNNPGKMYQFTEEGVLIGEYVTDHTGIFFCDGMMTTYLENGVPVAAGMVKDADGYYYYISSGYVAVTGSYYASRTNDLMPKGTYEFDEMGRMINPPELKNGPQSDGYFYVNGIRQNCYQLVQHEGKYYFINDGHKIAKNARIYLSAKFLEGTPFKVGYYQFDETGAMIIKHGPQEDGLLYIDGVKQVRYQLLEFEGNWYFINDGDKFVKGKRLYLSEQFVEGTPFKAGYYDFDVNGHMIIHHGPVDGSLYVNGVKQKRYQLLYFEDNGKWYFINDGDKYVVGKRLYLSEQFVEGTPFKAGYYDFDENGHMIIHHGPVDGYLYADGVKFKRYQLVEFEGKWYFINDGDKYVVGKRLHLSEQFVEGTPFTPGYYDFDENGHMIINHGPVDGYLYANGIKFKRYQLVEFEGNWYFINDGDKYAKNRSLYLSEQFVAGTPFKAGLYEFTADGHMITDRPVKNGPNEDGFFYIDDVRQKAYQLIEWEGDWYCIYDGHKIYKEGHPSYDGLLDLGEIFIKDHPYFKPGYYRFDKDGKMIGIIYGFSNGRDIGTVPFVQTVDGQDILEGLLIRGSEIDGAIVELTDEQVELSLKALNEFGIKTEIDLRSEADAAMGEKLFGKDVAYINYDGMVMYEEVFTAKGMEKMKAVFTDLANPDNYPIYMHCTYGIDRVGTVSYILEAVLGVSENNARLEYLLSIGSYGNAILRVRDGMAEFGGETFQENAENYLLACGITEEQIQSLRDIYLAD